MLVAVPVDLEDSLALVNHANSGLHPGVPHVDFPPIDAYREKCLQLVGDHCYDGEDDHPRPERPGDATILEWLENLVDSLRSSVSFNSSHITKLERMIGELRIAVARSVTTETSVRAAYENALTDLNESGREIDRLRAEVRMLRAQFGTDIVLSGTVVHQSADTAVIQWPYSFAGFGVGTQVTVSSSVNGTRTPDEKVGDPQYINAG